MRRNYLRTAITSIIFLLLVVLVIGAAVGQPMGLGYVTTESMEPALATGDGFIAIPAPMMGDIQEGDVVVYQAEELHDGGLITHRVIGETDGGYITKGDANPFTDQDGGEPPVVDEQIVATALQINDWVVTIPGLGRGVMAVQGIVLGAQSVLSVALGIPTVFGVQGVGYLLFMVGLLLFVVTIVDSSYQKSSRDRSRTRRSHDSIDGRYVALILLVIVVGPANFAMLSPATSPEIAADGDYLVAETAPDTPLEHEVTVENQGFITMLVMLDVPTHVATLDQTVITLPAGERVTTTMELDTPPAGEQQLVTVESSRYIMILPPALLIWLHNLSPLFALAAINSLLIGSVLGIVSGLLGFSRIPDRHTSRDIPLQIRLKQLLR